MIEREHDTRQAIDQDGAIETRHVLIVANPKAGGFSEATLATIAAALAENARHVEQRLSTREGDIRDIVADIGGAFDVVAVHGGDGSINEAVDGLRRIEGRRPALAIIAGGTANVLALETGARFDATQIARDIIDGRTTPLHYGLANGRPFVLMASAGLDAAVVHGLSRRLKAAIGKGAYVAAAIAQKLRPRTPDLVVTAAGQSIVCRLAICAKASRYGGDFVVAPGTHATRAGLQLVIVENDGLLNLLRIGWRLMTGGRVDDAGLYALAADEVDIAAVSPAPAQVDGDPFGTTPLRATLATPPLKLIGARRTR